MMKNKKPVVDFVKRQLKKPGKAVIKKAEKFLEKYKID